MFRLYKNVILILLLCAGTAVKAQTIVKGKIIDALTKEPIAGATIQCTNPGCKCGCMTNIFGEFEMKCFDCENHKVSSIGYLTQEFGVSSNNIIISLNPAATQLQQVVLTANRGEGAKRSEAPIAISTISNKTIQDNKPTMANKV